MLGLVVDADENPQSRWGSIIHSLFSLGYQNLPEQSLAKGTIITDPILPRVGIWIMPNNQLAGILEDFIAHLIPLGDPFLPIIDNVIVEIETQELNQYALICRAKARIHTWLAWQESLGQPMGQAIMTRVLQHEQPLAKSFVAWLNRLFNDA